MVSVAFGVAVAASGGTAAGLGLGVYAAIAAGGLLTSYIDQAYVYPALFGKKNPKPDMLEGLQLSTTDPGAPRWQVFGTRAWVPCHYLWSLNVRDEVDGGQVGKGGGGRPFTVSVRADVGLAACDGPVHQIEALYANETPFWSSQFNRATIEESRWAITAGTGADAGKLVITATDADVADFTGLFRVDDFVRLERVSPSTLLGYYRVAVVEAHTGTERTRIVLTPLRSQTPAAGVAGTMFDPAVLRRIDQGAASSAWTNITGSPPSPGYGHIQRPSGEITIPGAPSLTDNDLKKVWVVGGIYRFDGWSPAGANGLYQLTLRKSAVGGSDPSDDYRLEWKPIDSQTAGLTGAGSPTTPAIIIRDEVTGLTGTGGRGFLFIDSAQEFAQYPGTLDQPQDPTLAALEPDAPAHSGIAHISLKDWNLGAHNNTFPNAKALVRARFGGETVAEAIQRICLSSAPADSVDVSNLRTKALLGYAVPAGIPPSAALQPVMAVHGVVAQERGGVLTFLDERDLPIVPVATRHLNARALGEDNAVHGFLPKRVDPADIPERVILEYLNSSDGKNEADGDGVRAPGAADRGGRDTLKLNVRPMSMVGFEAKRRAREIRRRVQRETHTGALSLPPGYMDVLPGTCLTFRANNWHHDVPDAGPTLAFDTSLRDILPNSVAVQVRFADGQRATLIDDGAGALTGFPAGITAFTNTVDYEAGRIELLCSVALDADEPPSITYRYDRQWLVRVTKAVLSGHDFILPCDVVSTSVDDPLPPVPRDLRTSLGSAVLSQPPSYQVEVLDIPALFPGMLRSVVVGIVAAPQPGSTWRGAVVYRSPNGEDMWTAVGQIQAPSAIGTLVTNNLPTSTSPTGAYLREEVDWSTEMLIDLPNGETLDDATLEQIGYGMNWLLVGDELIGFHEVEAQAGTQWILRGLVRCMRGTILAAGLHEAGERVVLLTGLGGLHGLIYEPTNGFAAANSTMHLRVVPAGADITTIETMSPLVLGRSARPAPPILEDGMVTQMASGDIEVRWWRRGVDQASVFGPSPLQAGEFERYEVVAFNLAAALPLVGSIGLDAAIAATRTQRWIVGDESMGTTMAPRVVTYAQADYLAHGYIPGLLPIAFAVWQVGLAGRSEMSQVVYVVPA